MKRLIPVVLMLAAGTSAAHAATPYPTNPLVARLLQQEHQSPSILRLQRELLYSANAHSLGQATETFTHDNVPVATTRSAASPLALPSSVVTSGKGAQARFGSGQGPFSNYHTTWNGFRDAVGAQFDFQPIMTMFYAGTVFSTPGSARTFMTESFQTTAGYSSVAPSDCGYVGYSCKITSFVTDSGDLAIYNVAQVNNCTVEVGYQGNPDEISANSDSVSKLAADTFVLGVALAKKACTGAAQSAPNQPRPIAPRHPIAPTTARFHGNCFAFRGALWTLNVKNSTLVSSWWTDLQSAYNNNYPVPSGGSVPGPTQAQFNQAQVFMNQIHLQLSDDTNHVGLEYDTAGIGKQYGITNLNAPGRYAWALNRVFGAMYSLDLAAYEEWKTPNTGLNDYHASQQSLSNAWDALKQLPCR